MAIRIEKNPTGEQYRAVAEGSHAVGWLLAEAGPGWVMGGLVALGVLALLAAPRKETRT